MAKRKRTSKTTKSTKPAKSVKRRSRRSPKRTYAWDKVLAAVLTISCCCLPAAKSTPSESRAAERKIQQTFPNFDLDRLLLSPEIVGGLVIAGIALLIAWVFVVVGLWRSKRQAFVGLIALNLPSLILGGVLHEWIAMIPAGLQVLYALCRLWGWIGPKV